MTVFAAPFWAHIIGRMMWRRSRKTATKSPQPPRICAAS